MVRSIWLMSCLLAAPFVARRIDMKREGWRRLAPPPGVSVGVDCDLLDVPVRLLRFRKRHSQDAVLEVRHGLVFLDAFKWDLPLERAVVALADELRLVAALGFFLATDRKNAIGDFDLDILFTESRQFGGNRHGLVSFAEFEPRPGELALHQRIAKTTKRTEATERVVEQTVHLAVKRQKRIESLASGRELLAFGPGNKITNTHDILLDMKLVGARTLFVRARCDQAYSDVRPLSA